jgi:hypothetical protein
MHRVESSDIYTTVVGQLSTCPSTSSTRSSHCHHLSISASAALSRSMQSDAALVLESLAFYTAMISKR